MTKTLRIDHNLDEIWKKNRVEPTFLDALISEDCLIEAVNLNQPYDVIIGVPHQAAVGVKQIAENRVNKLGHKGRQSDEGAAFYALAAFKFLVEQGMPCKLVISAHDTWFDPNKDQGSTYWNAIFSEKTRLLFECHGSGETRHHDLEISSGNNQLGKPLAYGRLLAGILKFEYSIAAQLKAGKEDARLISGEGDEIDIKLELAANNTLSLLKAMEIGVPALHIEAKPKFRIPEDKINSITPDGAILGQGIAQSIIEYLKQ